MNIIPEIHLEINSETRSPFLRLFQKGVQVEVELGKDVLSLLSTEIRMTAEGIEKIQTIFWQGKPVDDLDQCHISENGVLALSAAMPGLAGACLRRGGAWSFLRDTITHQKQATEARQQRGLITIKLFNFMLEEVGPNILTNGIVVDNERLIDCLDTLSEGQISQLTRNETEISLPALEEMLEETGSTRLIVTQT